MNEQYNPQESFGLAAKHDEEIAALKKRQFEEAKPQRELAHADALEEDRLGTARRITAEYDLEGILLETEVKPKFEELVKDIADFAVEDFGYDMSKPINNKENKLSMLSYNTKQKELVDKIRVFKDELQEKNGTEITYVGADEEEKQLSVAAFLKTKIEEKVYETNRITQKDKSGTDEEAGKRLYMILSLAFREQAKDSEVITWDF